MAGKVTFPIGIAALSAVGTALLLASIWYDVPGDPTLRLLLGYLLPLAMLAVFLIRSNAFSGQVAAVDETKVAVIDSLTILSVVVGPSVILILAGLRQSLLSSTSLMALADAIAVILLICLFTVVVLAFIGLQRLSPTRNNSLVSRFWPAVSTVSFILFLGSSSAFSYLVGLVPAGLLLGNEFLRASVLVLLVGGLLVLFIFDVLGDLLTNGLEPVGELRTLRAYEELAPPRNVFAQISKAFMLFRVFLLNMISIIWNFLKGVVWRFIKSIIMAAVRTMVSIANNFDISRILVVFVVFALMFLGLLIESHMVDVQGALGASLQGYSRDLFLMVMGALSFLWMGGVVALHSRMRDNRPEEYATGSLLLMIFSLGGVWVAVVTLRILAEAGAVYAPGYSLRGGLFFVLFTAFILAVICWPISRVVYRTASLVLIVGGSVIWLLAFPAQVDLSLGQIVSAFRIPSLYQPTLEQADTKGLDGIETPRSSEAPSDVPTFPSSRKALVTSYPHWREWLTGHWGLDGRCLPMIIISGEGSELIIDFAGKVERQAILAASGSTVKTEAWEFTRAGTSMTAVANGESLGELVECD